jgi:O-antigen ligase
MIALSLLILLWPSYLIRATAFGIPTTMLEMVIYGVVAGTILSILMRRWPRPVIKINWLGWTMIALWAAAWIIATIASPDHRESLGALKAWWFDPMLFAGLLLVVVRSPSERIMLLKITILSGAIVAAAGLFQLAFIRDSLQEGRLSSFFAPVANYAAMYLAPIFVLGLAAVTTKIIGKTWLMYLGIIAVALLATLSYGGFAAVAVGSVVIWLAQPASPWKKRLAWLAIGVTLVGVAVLTTTKNFHQHFDAGRSSGSVRQQIWSVSWALIEKHPLLGIGPNAFQAAYVNEIPKHYFPPLEWAVAQPHNLYLALWLELGLLGLITALAATIIFFRAIWRLMRNPSRRPYALVAAASVIAILTHGLVDTPLFKNDLVILTTLILALPWLGRVEE